MMPPQRESGSWGRTLVRLWGRHQVRRDRAPSPNCRGIAGTVMELSHHAGVAVRQRGGGDLEGPQIGPEPRRRQGVADAMWVDGVPEQLLAELADRPGHPTAPERLSSARHPQRIPGVRLACSQQQRTIDTDLPVEPAASHPADAAGSSRWWPRSEQSRRAGPADRVAPRHPPPRRGR